MADPTPTWDDLAEWWEREVSEDPVYHEDVGPMFDQLLAGSKAPLLDLGCGEGQWLRWARSDASAFGTDSSQQLLKKAHETAPVVRATLPSLAWIRTNSIGTAFSLFVPDLVEDHATFFSECARIVEPGGCLVIIINHPAFTAPGSGPFMDPDSDVFWRWGEYLHPGESTVPAGSRKLVMYHRPIGTLLTSAAQAGWSLDEMIEAPLGSGAIEREPLYAGQENIPRFFGVRWRR